MLKEAKDWWNTHAKSYQDDCKIPIAVCYGAGSPSEEELGLLGSVREKRILEIGCGAAQAAISLAKQGAIVTAIDVSISQLEIARRLAMENMMKVTFIECDMADLSAIESESMDIVFSACAFAYVDDLESCFNEVYRVLTPNGLFVWGMGHPFTQVVDPYTLKVNRSYFDIEPKIEGAETGSAFASVHRKISDYFNMMVTAGFVVEKVLEPDSRLRHAIDPWYGLYEATPELLKLVPGTLIMKSRKQ